jgi:hypothetical protein
MADALASPQVYAFSDDAADPATAALMKPKGFYCSTTVVLRSSFVHRCISARDMVDESSFILPIMVGQYLPQTLGGSSALRPSSSSSSTGRGSSSSAQREELGGGGFSMEEDNGGSTSRRRVTRSMAASSSSSVTAGSSNKKGNKRARSKVSTQDSKRAGKKKRSVESAIEEDASSSLLDPRTRRVRPLAMCAMLMQAPIRIVSAIFCRVLQAAARKQLLEQQAAAAAVAAVETAESSEAQVNSKMVALALGNPMPSESCGVPA